MVTKTTAEVLGLDDSPIETDYASIHELFENMRLVAEQHPDWVFRPADDPGYHHDPPRVPRLGWVAFNDGPPDEPVGPMREWTIKLSDVFKYGLDLDSGGFKSAAGRMSLLEQVIGRRMSLLEQVIGRPAGPSVVENKATFFARLEPRLAPSDLVRVRGAYYLAKYGHRAQVRKELDGEGHSLRYFEHVRRTAIILMDEAGVYDPDLVITALLHDALEDTDDIDALVIEQFFGFEVARRVRLLTKAPKEGYVKRLQGSDELTVLVKLCDRLDNLRSLGGDEAFRRKQLDETKRVYLPLFEQWAGANLVLASLIDVMADLEGEQ
jgi:hypothetical protein